MEVVLVHLGGAGLLAHLGHQAPPHLCVPHYLLLCASLRVKCVHTTIQCHNSGLPAGCWAKRAFSWSAPPAPTSWPPPHHPSADARSCHGLVAADVLFPSLSWWIGRTQAGRLQRLLGGSPLLFCFHLSFLCDTKVIFDCGQHLLTVIMITICLCTVMTVVVGLFDQEGF